MARVMIDSSALAADFEAPDSLGRSNGGAIELVGDLLGFCGLEPHHADVVHVGDDGSDRAAFSIRWPLAPGGGREIFDQIKVDAVVGLESLQQGRR